MLIWPKGSLQSQKGKSVRIPPSIQSASFGHEDDHDGPDRSYPGLDVAYPRESKPLLMRTDAGRRTPCSIRKYTAS